MYQPVIVQQHLHMLPLAFFPSILTFYSNSNYSNNAIQTEHIDALSELNIPIFYFTKFDSINQTNNKTKQKQPEKNNTKENRINIH